MATDANGHRRDGVSEIVVGLDGSAQARDAEQLASELALAEGAELRTVSVETDDSSSIASTLQGIAAEEDARLIVIGSSHRAKLERVALGSVAEKLLKGSRCAVAVAPKGYAGRSHFGIGIIAVGVDGSAESRLATQEAKLWATGLGCSLSLIAATAKGSRSRAEDALRETLVELDGDVEAEAVLEDVEDAAAVLAEHGVEADMLVLGSRGQGPVRRVLLGSVSSEVMQTAPCPVLVVPNGKD